MPTEHNFQEFRRLQVKTITNQIGVYALCDLDETPIYIGQSTDGICARVRRHLTSAKSDIIANRLVDVWEIAFVWAWPVPREQIGPLEAHLFCKFHSLQPLMNGSLLPDPGQLPFPLPEKQTVQIMTDEEIRTRLEPELRLPRQIEHFSRLVDHILNVKNSPPLRASLGAHFARLTKYYDVFVAPRAGDASELKREMTD